LVGNFFLASANWTKISLLAIFYGKGLLLLGPWTPRPKQNIHLVYFGHFPSMNFLFNKGLLPLKTSQGFQGFFKIPKKRSLLNLVNGVISGIFSRVQPARKIWGGSKGKVHPKNLLC